MHRILWAGLAGLSLLVCAAPAFGKRIAPLPIPLRVAQANVVVVGKVTAIEDKTVKAERFPGDTQPAEYKVAIVKVEEALLGAKGQTHVRVGFIPSGGGPRRPYFRSDLAKGQEACLLLTPHPKANFSLTIFDGILDRNQATEVKKTTRLLADPMAALKAKSKDERLLMAALLIQRYRTPRAGAREETIGADESKLILEAIAGADWAQVPGRDYRLSPQAAFQMLNLQPADGWQSVGFQQLETAAKQWIKDNAGKYRLKRYVVEQKK
jgi:hypothetical protein